MVIVKPVLVGYNEWLIASFVSKVNERSVLSFDGGRYVGLATARSILMRSYHVPKLFHDEFFGECIRRGLLLRVTKHNVIISEG